MTNRASLLNTAFLTSDEEVLEDLLARPGNHYAEVAFASYRLPVPWLRCFRQSDLRPVTVKFGRADEYDFDDDVGHGHASALPSQVQLSLPCTTVAQAIANLECSLPLFVQIGGDAQIAQDYLDSAIAGLKSLPLPFLTLSAKELILGGDVQRYMANLKAAMGDGEDAIPALKALSCAEDGALAYPLDVLRSVSSNHERKRMANALALDAGIVHPGIFSWHDARGEIVDIDPAANPAPPRPPNTLGGIADDITRLLKAELDGGCVRIEFLRREPGKKQSMQLVVLCPNAARLKSIQAHAPALDACNARLKALADGYGFEWTGWSAVSKDALAVAR